MRARGWHSVLAIGKGPSIADRPRTWNLLFSRQPESNLEFTEEWLDEATTLGSPLPIKPPKQSRRRPLLWVVFILLIGGGAYAAIEPEMVMEYLGSLLGDPPAPQPPVAHNSTPSMAAPSKQPEQDWSFLAPSQTTTPSSPAPAPTPTASAPRKVLSTATPVKQPEPDWSFLAPDDTAISSSPDDLPPATASTPATTATASKQSKQDWSFLAKIESFRQERNVAPGTRGAPVPMFREGQRVSVRPDLNAPGWAILLRQDAEGTMPGPTILPGTVLTILDGDLQGRNWVYFVRSDIGSEGWLTEGQLRSKR